MSDRSLEGLEAESIRVKEQIARYESMESRSVLQEEAYTLLLKKDLLIRHDILALKGAF